MYISPKYEWLLNEWHFLLLNEWYMHVLYMQILISYFLMNGIYISYMYRSYFLQGMGICMCYTEFKTSL